MVRVARERIADLFALAERESARKDPRLATRYVALARKVGTRYNVRLPSEYRELYCRGCSSYWVEGRTVRTRLRGPGRVRTCLACGRVRRMRLTVAVRRPAETPTNLVPGLRDDAALVGAVGVEENDGASDDTAEEE